MRIQKIQLNQSVGLWGIAHLLTFSTGNILNQHWSVWIGLLIALINTFKVNRLNLIIGNLFFLLYWSYHYPNIPNHGFLLLIANVLCLKSLIDKKEMNLTPFLLVAYFFAGLHKLNADFFNPAVSCVRRFLLSGVPFSNNQIVGMAFGCIFLELGIPLFLLTSLRKWAYVVLGAFHSYLVGFGFLHFAGVIPLFFLLKSPFEKIEINKALFYSFLLLWIGFSFSYWPFRTIFYCFSMFLFMNLYWHVIHKNLPISLFQKNIFAYVLVLLTFWHGIGPYLGGPHYPSFSMFSNLIVTTRYANTFFPTTSLIEEEWYEIERTEKAEEIDDQRISGPLQNGKRYKELTSKRQPQFISQTSLNHLNASKDWKIYFMDGKEARDYIQTDEKNFFKYKFFSRRIITPRVCFW